ncbi:CDP-alcohol phosphatidyltransferase family protein [Mesorhizobium sp. LHD-90]|uniref:CDP-alcohol phosphatidyltransferase family protein n=1 Tax=Mesorhizobium sp. LHD-90 TaxID=3071414 RepID=UPI0027E02A61|nr:CDP-alcohol phosphatidyltransferase family protein [Mesorhizobium sp. LHD-90]MDQ6432786.1 CDP-alcohol phosphatidyltransferase family protein [Mesorhizobium sp. LHD-90]
MPTLYDLKPAFQGLLRPLADRLAKAGVTANQITVAAAVMSVAAAALVALFPEKPTLVLIIPIVLFLRMALNAIDGMLAREHGQASTFGMYLNELCDVVSDLALILAFAALPVFPAWSVVAFAITAVMAEYAGVLGVPAGIGRNYAGPLGKSDRAFALSLIAVLLAFDLWIDPVAPYVFPALALLSLLTVANRVRAGLRSAA